MTIIDHVEPAGRLSLQRVFASVGRARQYLDGLDREHRMTLDRLVINLVVLGYLIAAARFGLGETQRELELAGYLIVGYNLISLALFSAVLGARHMAELRRHLGIWLDLGLVCALAHVGGSSTAFLYPFILWTIFSNGLRFGQFYLIEAAGAGVFSFSVMVLTTPFWRDNIPLSIGLLIGLIMLPTYLSRPIRGLSGARAEIAAVRRARKKRPSIRYEPAAADQEAVPEQGLQAAEPEKTSFAAERAVAVSAPTVAPSVPEETPVMTQSGRRSLSILVAEDTATNQMVIAKILSRAGHRATIVADGKAALDALVVKHFDLVLMDLNMPGMNGIDATKLYRFAALGHYVPIVALTADATEAGAARCRAAGMDACFSKPIDPHVLLAYLDKVGLDGQAPVAVEAAAAAIQPPAPNVAPRAPEAIVPEEKPIPVAPKRAAEVPALKETVETAHALQSAPDEGDAGEESVIDMKALNDLEKLGGQEFVQEIIAQFVGDAAAVLKILSQAVNEGSVGEFREQAHALRSCAANVGARRVYELCLAWRELDARELASHGRVYMQQLEAEFHATLERLKEYSRTAEAAPPPQDAAPQGKITNSLAA